MQLFIALALGVGAIVAWIGIKQGLRAAASRARIGRRIKGRF